MKKVAILVSLAALVVLTSCGGGGKYADAKAVINNQLQAMETFSIAVEKAQDSPQIVAALDQLQQSMEKLMPRVQKLQEKYPEIKDKKNPPEELKEVTARMEGGAQKFMGAMMKVATKYGEDPKVQEAMKKIQKLGPSRR